MSYHEDDFLPTNHTLTIQELIHNPKVVKILRGQPLGKVGFSGLGWGYTDYQADRDQANGKKFAQRDTYGIYSTSSDYPTPTRQGVPPQEPLFFMDDNHLPQFA